MQGGTNPQTPNQCTRVRGRRSAACPNPTNEFKRGHIRTCRTPRVNARGYRSKDPKSMRGRVRRSAPDLRFFPQGARRTPRSNARGDKSVRRRAESQWIVAARLLCHLQYPATYLSRLQRIHLPDRLELPFRAPGAATSATSGETLDTCSRGRTSAPTISRVTTGEVESAASSMDSDLEAFSHNPTHGSFAPLAFQPSAMTNYVNQRFLSY